MSYLGSSVLFWSRGKPYWIMSIPFIFIFKYHWCESSISCRPPNLTRLGNIQYKLGLPNMINAFTTRKNEVRDWDMRKQRQASSTFRNIDWRR